MEPLLLEQEVADILRIHVRTLQKKVKQGKITPVIDGRRPVTFEASEVKKYIREHRVPFGNTLKGGSHV